MAPSQPRCRLEPLPEHQVAFLVEDQERLRWHFGPQYPRPFFYPLLGPASGQSLTRIGHPGAPNHDHHRSIWFGHAKASGIDFWSENTPARIRQLEWLAFDDGETEAVMTVRLGWFDGHDPRPLLEQLLIAALRPGPERETFLEIQTTLKPVAEKFEFQQSNFGLMAVRVAKSISAYFGGGTLTSSSGAVGESAIFGKPAVWMDYSGKQPGGAAEGITFFDHPSNLGHPTSWHVREDGWMGASLAFGGPVLTTRDQPLTLRYLLHAHRGLLNAERATAEFKAFSMRPGFRLIKAPARHTAFTTRRHDQ